MLAKGEALNLDLLSQYAARQRARREKLQHGLEERLLKQIIDDAPSRAGSPTAP